MDDFIEKYEKYSAGRQLSLHIEHLIRGIPRWRIHIFEKDGAPVGDKELVFAEDPSKEECIRKATEIMEARL